MTTVSEPPQPVDVDPSRRAVMVHRRGSRWMHWINFPLITIMIWSGLRIYWAEDVYAFGILGWQWFEFFPEWFYERLDLNQRLARGLAFHLNFAWLFVLNGLAFAIYTWRTGEWRELVPSRRFLKDSFAVLLHDLRLRKGEPPKRGRYNEAQRLAYSGVLILGLLAVLSGFAIYKPAQLSALTWLMGGYSSARLIHFTVTILFMLFFVVHILQVARAGFGNFFSMVTGYRLQPRPSEPADDREEPSRV